MNLSRRAARLGAAAVIFLALAQLVAPTTYVQSGSCYTDHSISVTSCGDVSSKCNSNSCSSSNGYITYTCYYPHSCSGSASPDNSAPSSAPALASSPGTYNGYDQSGSCYTVYDIKITSCNDLNGVCSSRTCSNMNGQITYSCYSPHSCSGIAAPATPAPTPSPAKSNDCIKGRNLQLMTCAETSPFNVIGCKCFTCNEVNGHIKLACKAPFECFNDFDGSNAVPDAEAPKLDTTDYVVICVVYVAVAGVFAAVAWWRSPKRPEEPSAPKQSMITKALAFLNPVNLVSLAVKKAADAFVSYLIEPNMRSDGTMTAICEFWASMNLWVALLSQVCGCCCARPRQPPPNYKPPISVGRAIAELLADICITFSLAFLVGTVVNNSVACNSVINGDFCQQGSSTISTKEISSTSNGQCQSVDVGKTIEATILTAVLTRVVGVACGYAEGTAKDDAKRKSIMLAGRVLVTIALLGFGIGYSFALTSSASGSEVATRRYKTIWTVLGPSWVVDQAIGVIGVLVHRFGLFIVCIIPKQARSPKADQSASSVVRPTANERPLQPPDINTMVHETDVATPVKNVSRP